MKILVTGSNGMLGQDLCPILEDEGYELIETDAETFDVTNFETAKEILTREKPDIVIHCAAYTKVDKAEEEQDLAFLINAKGTENIAKICGENDITLVYISTDYVFDGDKKEPYLPEDKPNPINIYGKTKFEGEKAVQKYCKKYYIVRTSWLYGHHGKNFVETMISSKDKAELKVVDDQIGCPTWTVEFSGGIAKLIQRHAPFGIYHICSGGKTSWYNFAREIFKQTGLPVNVKPCKTEEFPRPAKRPKYSVMDNQKLCRNWEAALKDYLDLR
ncbi:MAG: dTDP-4-dehydrorhamnose reductase [Candidatus Gastranaerophilaceae bacterium]